MANMTFKASLLPSADNTYSLGSNDTNNLKRWKINGFSGGPIEYIVGEQTAATGSWTGTTQDSELITGKTIAYKLPFAGSGNASLTLTFTNPTGDSNSGAIPVYLNNSRVTTHYAANSVIIMVYDGASWRSTDYWNSNSRDAGYGKINLTQSNATTAITTNTTQLAAHTYNEAMTLTAGNKWVQFQGTNSGSNNADILTVGHSLSGVTAGDYGDDSDQTPAYAGTFNVPTLSVDAAGHITAISTHTVKIPASDNTDIKQRTYGSTTNIELPIAGINGSASTTATVPSIGTSYKDVYAAIPTTNIATINPSTGKITIPGGLKVGVGNSTRMPTTGITIQDTRTEEFTPGVIGKGINFFFTNKTNPVGNSWCSGIYVHGWEGTNYGAWCLTGPAGDADVSTKPLYVRTSKSATEWGAYRKIYDTANKPTPSEILDESDTTKFWRGDNTWSDEISGGLLKITNNNNTLSIGSQNTNYTHFESSADRPFYFNKTIYLSGDVIPAGDSNSKKLGSSSKRWQKLYIGTADSYGTTTQPIYWNAGVPTAITYTANRLYYPSAVNAFTAGTHYVSDTKIAINSTSVPNETLYVNGITKVADGTDATSNSAAALVVTGGLAVGKKVNIGTLDGGQHIINGSVQLNAQSGSYNEGLRINRSTTGYANIYLGGTRSSASGAQTGGWWIGTLSTPNDATSTGDSITNTVFTISNNSTADTLSIKGTRGATIGTNSGWAIRPRLAIGTTYQTGYNLYVNGTSYHNGNDTHAGNINPEADNTRNIGTSNLKWANMYATTFHGVLDGNATTATQLSNTPNNATTFLRGDNTWTNALANTFYTNASPGFNNTVAEGAWSYIHLQSGSNAWHIATRTDHLSGSLQFRPASVNGDMGPYICTDGKVMIPGHLTVGGYDIPAYSLSTNSFICNSWIRTVGQTGWFNETYGGGWYMVDDTYIRNFNSKQVYLNAQLGVDATLRMWSSSRQITRDPSGCSWVGGRNGAILRMTGTSGEAYCPITSCKSNNGSWEMGTYTANNGLYFTYITDSNFNANTNTTSAQVEFRGSDNSVRASKVYGAVWNDYAEYRKDNKEEKNIQEPGRCVKENGDGTLSLTTKRLERGCEIISDTFGFAIGQDEENGYNTPIASSGRVLAYPYEPIEEFASHIGYAVCSGPNGTVSIMTDEEEEKYPIRAIGTISEIPDYEEWGTGKVKVNGRVWIRIR